MATGKQTVLGIFVAVVAFLAIGYGTAWLSRDACARDTLAEMRRVSFQECDLQGRPIALSRYGVDAEAFAPFLVATFASPRDTFGNGYMRVFVVMPWGRYMQESKLPPSLGCGRVGATPSRPDMGRD